MAGQDRAADHRPVTYRIEDPYDRCGGDREVSPTEAAELLRLGQVVAVGTSSKPGVTIFVPTNRRN